MADPQEPAAPADEVGGRPPNQKLKTTYLFDEMRAHQRRNRVLIVIAVFAAAGLGAGMFFALT